MIQNAYLNLGRLPRFQGYAIKISKLVRDIVPDIRLQNIKNRIKRTGNVA
jgi:hypothetical protein